MAQTEMIEIYKNFKIEKAEYNYYEATNLNDCDAVIKWSKNKEDIKEEIDQEDYKKSNMIKDTIVKKVLDKYKERSDVGVKKYGTTLNRNDLEFKEWIIHLQEELMDATLYLEKILESNKYT